jgi:hypothetical protein
VNQKNPQECVPIEETDICNLYDINQLCIECKEADSIPVNYINPQSLNKVVCVKKPSTTWMAQKGVYAISESGTNHILFNKEFCLSNSNDFLLEQIEEYEAFYFLPSSGNY